MKQGNLYRVTKAAPGSYLTVGEIYRCDSLSKSSVGLHRPTNGAGTYVPRWQIQSGEILLEEVGA